ncbi:MAG: LysR substrate-binding domain-containing protein, partial [Proteobacteria bacterium]|nr:LysR substrate-binding domain-containing protein [Pseudomonadota bacterium]
FADFQTSLTIRQPVYGVMAASHPLAKQKVLRIGQCLEFPLALPPAPNALRLLLEGLAARSGSRVEPVVQSDSYEFLLNYGREEEIVTFYFPVGIPAGNALENRVSRPVDPHDIPPVLLYLGHLRNRILPVAAARFADQLTNAFVAAYECD